MRWVEAMPIVVAAAAALLYTASLGLSSILGFVGLALAVYALFRGARVWVVALGIAANGALAASAALILLGE
jgi:hypothetical protein